MREKEREKKEERRREIERRRKKKREEESRGDYLEILHLVVKVFQNCSMQGTIFWFFSDIWNQLEQLSVLVINSRWWKPMPWDWRMSLPPLLWDLICTPNQDNWVVPQPTFDFWNWKVQIRSLIEHFLCITKYNIKCQIPNLQKFEIPKFLWPKVSKFQKSKKSLVFQLHVWWDGILLDIWIEG